MGKNYKRLLTVYRTNRRHLHIKFMLKLMPDNYIHTYYQENTSERERGGEEKKERGRESIISVSLYHDY